jgi:hypothetical protein
LPAVSTLAMKFARPSVYITTVCYQTFAGEYTLSRGQWSELHAARDVSALTGHAG